jgi:hypothetical protein
MAAEVFAAWRGQQSPSVLSDSGAVVARSTPTRLRRSDFAAALMPEAHAVDCAEGRVATQHLDGRWWGLTR